MGSCPVDHSLDDTKIHGCVDKPGPSDPELPTLIEVDSSPMDPSLDDEKIYDCVEGPGPSERALLSGIQIGSGGPVDSALQDVAMHSQSPDGSATAASAELLFAYEGLDWTADVGESWLQSMADTAGEDDMPSQKLEKLLKAAAEAPAPERARRQVPFIPWGVELTIPEIQDPFDDHLEAHFQDYPI